MRSGQLEQLRDERKQTVYTDDDSDNNADNPRDESHDSSMQVRVTFGVLFYRGAKRDSNLEDYPYDVTE